MLEKPTPKPPATFANGIYALVPNASASATFEHLHTRTTQLKAMLILIYGGGAESFNTLSDELRDQYLWACSDIATECEELVSALAPAISRD